MKYVATKNVFGGRFPIVFAAVYWRRLTKFGAYTGVLAAIASWIYLFQASNFAKNAEYSVDFHVGGMNSGALVVTMFVCSSLAMIVESLITPPPR